MMGDFNIAPTDLDVFDPDLWREKILCSSIERKQFSEFEDLFLADSFRLKNKKPNQYSWWDYRQGSFRKNEGLRIDHILLSKPLVSMCSDVGISTDVRKHEKPSDHAPVWANLDFKIKMASQDLEFFSLLCFVLRLKPSHTQSFALLLL